jgi:HAE1 family hydrophobic/amphiphilic exporter-1
MNLTKTAITRPIFIFMLMLAAFGLGAISYLGMRVELNPDVSFGTITITTSYPGAAPEDINDLVSRKIEQAVSGVTGVREVTSSSQEGLSMVVVTLELDANVDSALNDVRSKVDSISNNLPKDALKPQVVKFDNSASPVLNLSFSSTTLSSRDLRDLIDNTLSDRFAQITGVASATVQGGDTREIEVQVSRAKLRAYSLGIADVLNAVTNASLNAPSGHLVNGQQDYTVRVKGDFTTPADIEDTVINVSDPTNLLGKPRQVRLTDVATVKDTVVERTAYSRLNGADSIVLAIQKLKEGNAVQIAGAAKKLIADVEKEYKPQGLHIEETFDQSKQIVDSVSDLQFSLMFGIFLVSGIVFVFLHNFRGTLIVALAIPTSIFASFVAMKLAGFTINNMSMLALSLAIGVLVDDAIVVLENIYRHLKMGEDPRDAALNGRMEIGLAALAITFADVVVFLPIAFMGGITGQFFKPLALGFVFATLFSLFVSFTLTPLLAARWYKAGEDMDHPTGGFAIWFEARFAGLEHGYRKALEWALHHRWFVFCIGNAALFAVIAFIAGSFSPSHVPQGLAPGQPVPAVGVPGALSAAVGMLFFKFSLVLGFFTTIGHYFKYHRLSAKFMLAALGFSVIFPISSLIGYEFAQWKGEQVFKFAFLPDSDSGQITANIELPTGSSLPATEAIVERVEKVMMADKDVQYVVSNVGTQGVGTGSSSNNGPNYAQVAATLYDKLALTDKLPWNSHKDRLRTRSSDSVAADLTEKIGRVPGASVKIAAQSGFNFGSAVQLSFRSDNRELLMKTAESVRDGLASGIIKGIINPDISSKPGRPELRVIPDRMALADNNLDVNTLGTAARTLYQGNNDNKMRVNGLEYDVRVMMDYADRDNPANLQTVPIKYVQGQPVLLGSVSTISQAPGVSLITRRDRSEEVQVSADILPGYANGSVNADVVKWMQDKHLVPEGVEFKPLGAADAQSREVGFLMGALFMGVILVYMLLASLYDNLLYPFIIQIAQPQAMVGALLGLMITNESLNLVGFIGIVALTGLVAKNAILVVDYTNTLRDRGRNRHDALVEAGPTRLRPIMMTTIALILGMLPIALALGRGSEFRQTIGTIVIGGITLSTMLTLLVIPCSYTIFDDLTIAIAKLLGKTPAHGGADDAETESFLEPVH